LLTSLLRLTLQLVADLQFRSPPPKRERLVDQDDGGEVKHTEGQGNVRKEVVQGGKRGKPEGNLIWRRSDGRSGRYEQVKMQAVRPPLENQIVPHDALLTFWLPLASVELVEDVPDNLLVRKGGKSAISRDEAEIGSRRTCMSSPTFSK
jgi:hypothetical protein